MADQPKMTEFEMALEAAEKVQTQPKAKVHWPAPGGAGAAYPSPPKGARPQQQEQPLPGKLPGATEEKDERAKNKPPTALIAVAVVLVIVAAAVFYFMKKGGGEETPASDETAVEKTAAASPGRTPAPAASPRPAGAPAAASPSAGAPKSSGSPAAPKPAAPTPAPEPEPKPLQEYAKVSQAELEQLVIGISYEEAVGIIGGEGNLTTDTLNEAGEKVWVYIWPTEGIIEPFINLKFINGRLDKTILVEG